MLIGSSGNQPTFGPDALRSFVHYDSEAYIYLLTTVRTDEAMCTLVTLDPYFQYASLIAVHGFPSLQSGILALSSERAL
jgi:hypothetical protein